MRLYPKKLRSINDLQKERALLAGKARDLEKEDIFSVEGLIGKKKDKGNDGVMDLIVDFLPFSNPVISTVSKIIRRMVSSKDKKPKIVNAPAPGAQPGKSKLKVVAKEFIGGYLKWKAIELSFKGIKHLVSSRKDKI